MTMTASQHIITKDNFENVVEELTYASKSANNYNSECFGMSDLKLAWRMDNLLNQFITRVRESGYCPHALMNPSMKKYEYWISDNAKRPELKQKLDDELRIDMSDFASSMDYAKHIFCFK